MKKYSALIFLPCAFALLAAERVGAAPVEWDFIATGCASGGGCISGQHYPVTLATLTLPGPDSSGSARSNDNGGATYTGDSFVLDFNAGYRPLTPTFVPAPISDCTPGRICNFDLAWSEVAGELTALRLYVNGFNDTLEGLGNGPFGLGGGVVASDNIYYGADRAFAGCEGPPCQISGYWVNDALVTAPEPGALALLASAFGVWGLAVRHANRNERNLIRLPHAGLDFFGGARGNRVPRRRVGAFGRVAVDNRSVRVPSPVAKLGSSPSGLPRLSLLCSARVPELTPVASRALPAPEASGMRPN